MQHNFYDKFEVHKNEPVLKDDRYRNMIGSLLFLANRTRSEIGTSVGILSQYSSKPTEFLIQAVKRVFRYLKVTKDFGSFARK